MTEGVECRKDEDVIDETPAAYNESVRKPGGRRALRLTDNKRGSSEPRT